VTRALALTLIALIGAHASAAPQADAPAPAANAKEPIVPVNDALARIEDLKKRVSLEPTEAGQRKAADELVAARQQLIRQHTDDPRLPFWFADYAEDSFTIALPSGGDVDRVLYGLSGPEPRRRVRTLVRDMLVASEQAERTAKDSLARTGGDALPTNLSDRLSQVERPRRIPLLRALAEVLQVEVGEFDSTKRRFVSIRPRNEALDTFCYALAAAQHPLIRVHTWRDPQWTRREAIYEPAEGDLFASKPPENAPEPEKTAPDFLRRPELPPSSRGFVRRF
jgi:hypothetical protein